MPPGGNALNRAIIALLGIWRPRRTRPGRTPSLCQGGPRNDVCAPSAALLRILLAAALAAVAPSTFAGRTTAADSSAPMSQHGQVPPGDWGGPHAFLRVRALESTLEFDCAVGRIEAPLSLDSEGRFHVLGTVTLESGGPLQSGQIPPKPRRARYDGWTDGREMRLTVTVLAEPEWELGQFTLSRGRRATLEKCL